MNIKINIVISYTGPSLAEHPKRIIEDFVADLNSTLEVSRYIDFSLPKIHRVISSLSQGEDINFDLTIFNWGYTDQPFFSYNGFTNALQLAKLWETFDQKLFHKNIRQFLGNTSVNSSIAETLKNHSNKFFYFNNGVTIIANSVKKKVSDDNKIGLFSLEGAHIVNGAQTVGVLGKAIATDKNELEKGKLMVKLISLESCPEGFELEITRATNTQNRVEKKDFISLDSKQDRLRTELFLENIRYSYKAGDEFISNSNTTNLKEAIIALACYSGNIQYAIWSKKEIGMLWDDINMPPYTDLFSEGLTGLKLWRIITIYRSIENAIKPNQARSVQTPNRSIAVHGSSIISQVVFGLLQKGNVENFNVDISSLDIQEKTQTIFQKMVDVINDYYPDAMFGRLFYNLSKTKDIIAKTKERLSA